MKVIKQLRKAVKILATKKPKYKKEDVGQMINLVARRLQDGKSARSCVSTWCTFFGIDASGVYALVKKKQKAYGNAIMDPVSLFSDASPRERVYLQLDNKSSRLLKGSKYKGDDDIRDFAGYLILLEMIEHEEETEETERRFDR